MHRRRRRGLAGSPILENEKATQDSRSCAAEVVPSVFGDAPGGSYCTAFGEFSSTLFPKKGKEHAFWCDLPPLQADPRWSSA